MGLFINKLVIHHFETQDRTQLEGKESSPTAS